MQLTLILPADATCTTMQGSQQYSHWESTHRTQKLRILCSESITPHEVPSCVFLFGPWKEVCRGGHMRMLCAHPSMYSDGHQARV